MRELDIKTLTSCSRNHVIWNLLLVSSFADLNFIAQFVIPFANYFIAEIISIESPSEYEKDSWQLDDTEKTAAINRLRDEGNELYRQGKIEAAEGRYKIALGMIEQLLMKFVARYGVIQLDPKFQQTVIFILFHSAERNHMIPNGWN